VKTGKASYSLLPPTSGEDNEQVMEEIKSAINWFEIPTIDFDRAIRFYSEIYSFDMPIRDMGHVKMGFFQHQQGDGIGGAIIDDTEGNRIYLHSMN
jgi:predicted enzyme related to lactoylglutathione lyase